MRVLSRNAGVVSGFLGWPSEAWMSQDAPASKSRRLGCACGSGSLVPGFSEMGDGCTMMNAVRSISGFQDGHSRLIAVCLLILSRLHWVWGLKTRRS